MNRQHEADEVQFDNVKKLLLILPCFIFNYFEAILNKTSSQNFFLTKYTVATSTIKITPCFNGKILLQFPTPQLGLL
jgi:hypothetical protein